MHTGYVSTCRLSRRSAVWLIYRYFFHRSLRQISFHQVHTPKMAYTKTPSFFPLYWRGIEFALHMTVFFLFLLQKAYTCPSSVQRNPCSYTFLILCLSILWWSFTLVDFFAQRNQKEGPEVEKGTFAHLPQKSLSQFFQSQSFSFVSLPSWEMDGFTVFLSGKQVVYRQTHVAAAFCVFVQYHVKGETLGKSFFFTLVIY